MSSWSAVDKSGFFSEPLGQLHFHTKEGQEIYRLLKREIGDKVKTIVEIGTWNGLGSTLCIIFGIKAAEGAEEAIESFHSLECNKEKVEQAKENLKSYPFCNVLWGTVLSKEDMSQEIIEATFNLDEDGPDVRELIEADLANCRAAPNVLDQLPENIDFLLLDGGEVTTYQEFETLFPRCGHFIVLDDVNTNKNIIVRGALQAEREWKEIYHSEDRNGFSIFQKLKGYRALR